MAAKRKYLVLSLLIILIIGSLHSENSFKVISNKKTASQLKSKLVNSNNYISLYQITNILLPGSKTINNYTISINDLKLKIYPGSFYMLIDGKEKTVYQFTYPVIKIDNDILLPFEETIFYLEQIKLIRVNRMNGTVFINDFEENHIIDLDTKITKTNVLKKKNHEIDTSTFLNTSEDIILEPTESHKIKSNNQTYPSFTKSVKDISPLINETFDLLLFDGSSEVRSILKSKSDSINETFSPDNYRLPKKLKRKTVLENNK
jgi:hypothetical protein